MVKKIDFPARLKELGYEMLNAAKREVGTVVATAEKQVKKEKLKRRFNLENPYKFVLLDSSKRIRFLDSMFARHAKRYDEDDILVFFGTNKSNGFQPHHRIKDLSDNSIFEVLEIVEVSLPVKYEEKEVEVPCTAVYCKVQ